WPVPVLVTGAKNAARLRELAKAGGSARLVIEGDDRRDVTATNVVGTIGNGDRTVVVSTPQSGWFNCGVERGTGIALFLRLAEAAAADTRGHRWVFVSTSGHERDNTGAHYFLEERAPAPADTCVWLHLGASIAAK